MQWLILPCPTPDLSTPVDHGATDARTIADRNDIDDDLLGVGTSKRPEPCEPIPAANRPTTTWGPGDRWVHRRQREPLSVNPSARSSVAGRGWLGS